MAIAAVERETGIGKDTLRAWERRYAFPRPERDAAGMRAYPPVLVERLRLIRRALLEKIQLTSTSGTICVELVRKLEISGCGVEEVGVHHYPRMHGRSQFFRIRSLAKTLVELLRLWVRVVVLR